MRRTSTVIMLVSTILTLALSGCSEKQKVEAKSTDIPAACKCVMKCAQTVMVEDPQGLAKCQTDCGDKFDARTLAEGIKRSMEVMSKARESCAD